MRVEKVVFELTLVSSARGHRRRGRFCHVTYFLSAVALSLCRRSRVRGRPIAILPKGTGGGLGCASRSKRKIHREVVIRARLLSSAPEHPITRASRCFAKTARTRSP